MAHVLEHVPAARGDTERRKVAEIYAFLRATAEYVHGIVNQSSRMPLASHWYVANAVELSPGIRARLVGPHVVEPGDAVSATESMDTVSACRGTLQSPCLQIQLVVPGDNRMVCTRWGCSALGRGLLRGVGKKDLPATRGRLQGVQVESDQIIEEKTLHLAAKDVDFGAQNIECVSVPSCGTGALGQGARPVFCCCDS